MSILQLSGHPQRISPSEKVTVYNADPNVAIIVGDTASPDTPISPKGAFTLLGGRTYWLSTADGSVRSVSLLRGFDSAIPSPVDIASSLTASGLATAIAADMIAAGVAKDTSVNAPAYNPPTHADVTPLSKTTDIVALHSGGTIASEISTTGAPLLALSTTPALGNPGVQAFAVGQTRSYGFMNMPQISYEISASISANAADTNPYMQVSLEWRDSATGLIVARENWYLAGPATVANTYSGTGRCKGDQLKVSVTWNGTNISGNCQFLISNTSRIYTRDSFQSVEGFNGIAGTTSATFDPDGGVLCSTNPNIGAGVSVTRSIALYSGTVRVTATAQNAFTGTVEIRTTGQFNAQSLASDELLLANIPSNGSVSVTLPLPRANCIIRLTNNGGAAMNITALVIISEQDI